MSRDRIRALTQPLTFCLFICIHCDLQFVHTTQSIRHFVQTSFQDMSVIDKNVRSTLVLTPVVSAVSLSVSEETLPQSLPLKSLPTVLFYSFVEHPSSFTAKNGFRCQSKECQSTQEEVLGLQGHVDHTCNSLCRSRDRTTSPETSQGNGNDSLTQTASSCGFIS